MTPPCCLFCRAPLTVECYFGDELNREHPRWVAECTACGIDFVGATEAEALAKWARGERLPGEIEALARAWVEAKREWESGGDIGMKEHWTRRWREWDNRWALLDAIEARLTTP